MNEKYRSELQQAMGVALCRLPIREQHREKDRFIVCERRILGLHGSCNYFVQETTIEPPHGDSKNTLLVVQYPDPIRSASIVNGEVKNTVGMDGILTDETKIFIALGLLYGFEECHLFESPDVLTYMRFRNYE
jgi:hypothetical protein